MTSILIEKGNWEKATHRRTPCEHEDNYSQAKERGLAQILPYSPQKEPTVLIPCSQISGLQNYESRNLWYLSPTPDPLQLWSFLTVSPVECCARCFSRWWRHQSRQFPQVILVLGSWAIRGHQGRLSRGGGTWPSSPWAVGLIQGDVVASVRKQGGGWCYRRDGTR